MLIRWVKREEQSPVCLLNCWKPSELNVGWSNNQSEHATLYWSSFALGYRRYSSEVRGKLELRVSETFDCRGKEETKQELEKKETNGRAFTSLEAFLQSTSALWLFHHLTFFFPGTELTCLVYLTTNYSFLSLTNQAPSFFTLPQGPNTEGHCAES